jgi:hypothetical protein
MDETSLDPPSKRPRRSHIFDRDRDDFYSEPEWCSARLFAVEPFDGLIWDPAAGLGTIPRAARAAGLSSFASDIADHGCGERHDFLTAAAPTTAPFNVVCNPPFKLARQFVEYALALGALKTMIIFPTARLNAARWLEPQTVEGLALNLAYTTVVNAWLAKYPKGQLKNFTNRNEMARALFQRDAAEYLALAESQLPAEREKALPLPLAKIYLLTPRPSMPPGDMIARGEKPGGGKTDFCWLVFDRTYIGPPTLRWLHRDGGKQ